MEIIPMETSINDNKQGNVLELLQDDERASIPQEALASVGSNPALTWIKFVLTDDKPNKNNQRVPEDEFDNLIKTGIFMPIKKAYDLISQGHKNTFPLGVITNLKKVGDKIEGLAALWNTERDDDVEQVKQLIQSGEQVDLSWEILYGQSSIEDGVEVLHKTALKAATMVKRPAYDGRTPILAIASEWSPAYLEKLSNDCFLFVDESTNTRKYPFKKLDGSIDYEELENLISTPTAIEDESLRDFITSKATELLNSRDDSTPQVSESNSEENTLDELEQLKAKVVELTQALEDAATKLNEATEANRATEQSMASINEELDSLRSFKAEIEANKARETKLADIKAKFAEAGVNKDETYFVENAESLLNMDENTFGFLLQELASFSTRQHTTEASVKVPGMLEPGTKRSAKELGKALREAK